MQYRKSFISTGVILAVIAVLKMADSYSAAQVYQGYIANQATQYEKLSTTIEDAYTYKKFAFEATNGNMVPVVAAFPTGQTGPFPTVVMLYGIGQKMTFLKEIAHLFTSQGMAIYMMEQYQRGERKAENLSDISQFLGLRKRATLNMLETRRLIDTLAQRPEVNAAQLYFWGISFGTITGVPTFVTESRFKGAVFSIGGAEVYEMSTTSETYLAGGFFDKLAGIAMGYYLTPAEPLSYAKQLSGRPILFQNALHDQLIPRHSAEALHRGAGKDKTVVWYDTNHEGTLNEQAINYFLDGIAWLQHEIQLANSR